MMDFSTLEQQNGLPPGLLNAVMQQESGGNTNAVSPKGATGAFQLMPATAQQYGVDPTDPDQSAQAAATMLGQLNQKYQGSIPHVLAGYNWGQGNVDRHGLQNAPPETQNYIQSVMGKLGNTIVPQAQAAEMPQAQSSTFDVTMPDGTVIRGVPQGTTQSQLQAKLAKMPSATSDTSMPLNQQLAANQNMPQGEDLGAKPAFYGGILSGAIPFGQKLTAGIGAGIAGGLQGANQLMGNDVQNPQTLGQYYDQIRGNQEATAQAHPAANLAGVGTGAVASLPIFGGIGDALAAGKFTAPIVNTLRPSQVAEGAGLLGKTGTLLTNMGKGAVAAAPVGAIYGAGAAPDGQEIQGAQSGATLAGVIGGAAPVAGAALNAGKNAINGIGDVLSQLTPEGREKIIGKIFNQVASDPQTALQNLQSSKELIPGSPFTTGEASADPGLISLQRGIRNSGANPFSDIESQQNTARNVAFGDVAQTPADLQAAIDTRASQAKNLYDAAYNSGPVNSDRIQEFLQTPELKAGINKGLQIQRLESVAAGQKFNPSDYSVTGFNDAGDPIIGDTPNMRLLDAGKKGLDAMISAQTDPVTGKVTELGRALTQFKNSYLSELDNINPAYAAARGQYSQMSQPINQLKTLQDIQGKTALNSAPDIQSGYPFLSKPNLTRALKDPEVQQILTPDQIQKLRAIEADMNRSGSLNQPNIRASGSDTAANLGVSGSVGNMLADEAINKIPLVGKAIQSSGQKSLNATLIQALKDPDLAAKLMQNAQSRKQILQGISNLSPNQVKLSLSQLLARNASQNNLNNAGAMR